MLVKTMVMMEAIQQLSEKLLAEVSVVDQMVEILVRQLHQLVILFILLLMAIQILVVPILEILEQEVRELVLMVQLFHLETDLVEQVV